MLTPTRETSGSWFEIGLDAEGDMRYGAWQIEDVIDLALQPLETEKLHYLMHFEPCIQRVTVRAQLRYFLRAANGVEVRSVEQTARFPGGERGTRHLSRGFPRT